VVAVDSLRDKRAGYPRNPVEEGLSARPWARDQAAKSCSIFDKKSSMINSLDAILDILPPPRRRLSGINSLTTVRSFRIKRARSDECGPVKSQRA
jgi:hypothetical protein